MEQIKYSRREIIFLSLICVVCCCMLMLSSTSLGHRILYDIHCWYFDTFYGEEHDGSISRYENDEFVIEYLPKHSLLRTTITSEDEIALDFETYFHKYSIHIMKEGKEPSFWFAEESVFAYETNHWVISFHGDLSQSEFEKIAKSFQKV
ncbi:hypothetical protein [Massiliimalia massiliensis]|uniref:hypothetical protein n=1 Tax=Massiliimalia massiliensis TaxID=1852384 RepID=UPI00117B2B2D|nr:hypothetical protein [Massiliimalia massiliensis]